MFFNGTCEEWVHEIQSQQRNSEKKGIAEDAASTAVPVGTNQMMSAKIQRSGCCNQAKVPEEALLEKQPYD